MTPRTTAENNGADDFPFYQFARLVRQAHLEGASQETLRLLIEEATARGAAKGASRALSRCGLEDPNAGPDITELRELLEAWRDTKRTARRAIVRWAVRWIARFGVAAIAFAVALRLKLVSLG
jgi:hypothetical protein